MASILYSPARLEALRNYPPGITEEALVRHFTLLPADLGFVNAHRGAGNRLGVALTLATLGWLGFVPDDFTAAPPAAVARLAAAVGVPAEALAGYGARAQTRTEHLREVAGTWVGVP